MWNDGGSSYGGGYQSMNTSPGFGGGFGGGGGYMQDPGFGSPTASQEKKRFNRAQSVLPCTINLLNSAKYSATDDLFQIKNIDLNQVTFVGVIRDAQETSTNITYKINDMTGEEIIVRKWIDNDENEIEQQKRSACREDTYVRVTGHMKSFQESRTVIGFSIVPITDFNEITYHLLDVIHSHLALSKQPELSGMDGGGMPVTPGGRNQPTTPGRMDTSYGGGGGGLGLSAIQRQVHDLISSCTSEEGMSMQELKQKLRGAPSHQIHTTVEFLSNEGHIYSTVDDDHFKSTDSGF